MRCPLHTAVPIALLSACASATPAPAPVERTLAVRIQRVASPPAARFACPEGTKMARHTPGLGGMADPVRCANGACWRFWKLGARGAVELHQRWCYDANGRDHGPYQEIYVNGQVAVDGAYVDGKQHGPWTMWSARGQLEVVEIYDHGRKLRRVEVLSEHRLPSNHGVPPGWLHISWSADSDGRRAMIVIIVSNDTGAVWSELAPHASGQSIAELPPGDYDVLLSDDDRIEWCRGHRVHSGQRAGVHGELGTRLVGYDLPADHPWLAAQEVDCHGRGDAR